MTRLIEPEDDEMNRILFRQEEILPSSGFTASVMDAVRREAAAPPPIPFPWKRALPVMVAGGFVLVMVFVTLVVAIAQVIKSSATAQFSTSLPSMLTPILGLQGLQGNLGNAAGWSVLALLVAFISVKLSMRLAADRA
ncbi:MAG: hypothetical protein WCF61_18980 [Terriglobales bacterium]